MEDAVVVAVRDAARELEQERLHDRGVHGPPLQAVHVVLQVLVRTLKHQHQAALPVNHVVQAAGGRERGIGNAGRSPHTHRRDAEPAEPHQ